MDSYLDSVFETFRLYWPLEADSAVNWYIYAKTLLVVELDSGEKILFDPIEKSLRYIRRNAEEENLDEKRWRYEFSQRLRLQMRNKGITQADLCHATGLTQATISHYMTGKRVPTLYIAKKIAETLSCTTEDLMDFPK